jgi:DNA repair protein RadC
MEPASVRSLSRVLEKVVEDPEVVAARLLRVHGSANAVFGANAKKLSQDAPPAVVEHLFAVKAWMRHALLNAAAEGPCMFTSDRVLKYLQFELSPSRVEQFRVLYVNKNMNLITDETIGIGNEGAVLASVNEVCRRVLDLNAKYIILAHNHPGGSVTPTVNDVGFTKRFVEAGRVLDFEVLDHIIVAKENVISMKRLNLF